MSPDSSRVRPGVLLGEITGLVVVAWVVFLTLRAHLLERYRVSSHSMEPALHGAEGDEVGDVLLVDRSLGWRGTPLHRFDVVVVRNRIDPDGDQLVKRVMASGPATVEFRNGDLWVRDAGSAIARVVVKDPVRQRDMLPVALWLEPRDPSAVRELAADACWSVVAGSFELVACAEAELAASRTAAACDARGRVRPPGHLSLARPVDSSFLDSRGRRRGALGRWPRDLGIEIVARPGPGLTAVHLVHQYQDVLHAVRIGLDGEGRFLRMGREDGPRFALPPWPRDGAPRALWFGYLDGRFFVVVDGRLVAEWVVPLPDRGTRQPTPGEPYRRPDPNLLHVGAAGAPGAVLWIDAITVRHDPYVPAEDRPFELEVGDLFLLGDNVHESTDSRDLVGESFRVEDVVGRAVAILAPVARARWFAPNP
ncbi:MAG: hypothetical protein IPM29_31510 [Planctomycetes bacterium]|nr:hypothetical protein [Planctomycetota bacterium]